MKKLKNELFRTIRTKSVANTLMLMLFGYFLIGGAACKKDKNEPDDLKTHVLVIENGAQKIAPDKSVTYSAKLIDKDGNVTTPNNVVWTTNNNQVASISAGGVITVTGVGMATVKASVSINGNTLTAEAPLGIYAPSLFAVAPAAILYEIGGSIQLEAIYLSTSGIVEPSCSFESSDATVASVTSNGLVSFHKAGSCYITVTASSLDGQPTNIVPVTVIGPIEIPLSVVRVNVTPSSADLFRNETVQLSAKAYSPDGNLVTGKTPVWKTGDPSVVTVSSTGLVNPVNPGETFVYATIDGIIGQAYLIVNPDTIVMVEPFYVSVTAGGTKQFTATAYHLTRNSASIIPGINFGWEIPTYGFSMFDIATVNNSGLVTVKSDAMPFMMTFVMAYDITNPNVAGGAAIISALADDCDCGSQNPNVSYINVNQQTVNLDMMMNNTFQIQATAYDVNHNPVQASFVYCSNSVMAASVDGFGEIVAMGPGEAIIKVCVGSVFKEITVNVVMF